MAGQTGAPKVAYRHHVARAEHQIGVVLKDGFVPFATLSDARFEQLVENSRNEAGATPADEEDGD